MASKKPKKAGQTLSGDWKGVLIELLDKHTEVPLAKQLKDGTITDDALLFLNLGISPERLQALAVRFNDIIKTFSSVPKPKKVSVDDLGGCETLADVFQLIGSRM